MAVAAAVLHSEIEDSDPEDDGLKEIEIMAGVSDEEVNIYDIKSDGQKILNSKKSYLMEHVAERVGVMINKDVKYYN
jgi:hypothetical protein